MYLECAITLCSAFSNRGLGDSVGSYCSGIWWILLIQTLGSLWWLQCLPICSERRLVWTGFPLKDGKLLVSHKSCLEHLKSCLEDEVAGRLAFPVTFTVKHTSCTQKPYSSYRTPAQKGIMGSLSILKGISVLFFLHYQETNLCTGGKHTKPHWFLFRSLCAFTFSDVLNVQHQHEATDVQPRSRGDHGSRGHTAAN